MSVVYLCSLPQFPAISPIFAHIRIINWAITSFDVYWFGRLIQFNKSLQPVALRIPTWNGLVPYPISIRPPSPKSFWLVQFLLKIKLTKWVSGALLQGIASKLPLQINTVFSRRKSYAYLTVGGSTGELLRARTLQSSCTQWPAGKPPVTPEHQNTVYV